MSSAAVSPDEMPPDEALEEAPEEALGLDERIDLLTEMLTDATDEVDAAELLGMLGVAWWEVYERDGDEAALGTCIDRLGEALDVAPGHAEASVWRLGRGLALCGRANLLGVVEDYGRAIDCLSGPRPEDENVDSDDVAMLLVEAHWERYWLLRQAHTHDAGHAHDDVALTRRLVGELDAIVAGAHSENKYAPMMAGVCRLELYELGRERADLDRGIEVLAAVLRDPPSDTPRLGLAGARLADAYRDRSVLDDDLASLDLSIDTGDRAVGWSSGEDGMTWRMAHQNQAVTRGVRWRLSGERADLDAALASWRALVEAHGGEPLDAWKAAGFGDLLRERGELDGDEAQVAEAVTLLERATQASPDQPARRDAGRADAAEDPEAWQRWFWLGRAYHALWGLGQAPGSLEDAERCLDRALRLGAGDDDDVLAVHMERLGVGGDAFTRDRVGRGDRPDQARASAAGYARLQVEGRAALGRATGAEADLRSRFALTLAWAELGFADPDFGDLDQERVRGLLDLAGQRPDPPPGWPALLELCDGVWECLTGATLADAPQDGGVANLARALTSAQVDDNIRELIRQILPIAAQLRAMRSGDLRLLGAAERLLRHGSPASPDVDGQAVSDESRALADVFAVFDRGLRGDVEAFTGLSPADAGAVAALPPPPEDQRGGFASMVRSLRQLADGIRGEPVQPRPETSRPLPARGQPVDDALLSDHLVEAVAHVLGALARDDLGQLRASVAGFEALAERVPEDNVLRLGAGGVLGQAYLEIARRDGRDENPAQNAAQNPAQNAAQNAVRWFAEASRLARGPEHPQWPKIALGLAEASRRAGEDPARSRSLGLSALAAHARRVLLQAGTGYAIEAARVATADAVRVAGWCLEDHAYDELVAVLDASRGLVLRAATSSRGVDEQLRHLGEDELSARWRATGGLGRDQLSGDVLADAAGGLEVPDDLRVRVLAALTDSGPDTGLLEPVRLDTIGASLSALGADALVYLVAPAAPRPGLAAILPAGGGVEVLSLPGLTIDADTPIIRYARAGALAGDGGPGAGADGELWARGLDDLCLWAWASAMGELVDHVRRWRLGRPARLVLVPMGMLALVPWHAAYTLDGSTRRYAVRDVVFSYIPSARMLGEAARHPVRPIRSALVVGDPGGDRTFAGREARAVHSVFYPSGTYLGQGLDTAAGAGTPAEVRAFLAAAPGPSLLHFACHGHADPAHPAGAHLSLAGGTLSAADLLDSTRLEELTMDRVFLAACTTNTAGADYDEAFSLATAFLAAGAHTVFGSLWPVPDVHTSLLMFMVHHFLNVGALAPMDALRAAQLWMLDPDRAPPAELPRRLAAHARRPEPADPVAWAAFTHLGR